MKPVPVPNQVGSGRKHFKIQTREYAKSKEKSAKKITNPFRNLSREELEKEK